MQEDRLVQTFLDLVKIDSPTGHEEKARKYVSKFIEKIGLKPFQNTNGNLIVKVDGVGETLLLGAHLDTVEPGRNIKPQIENGIIKSDGTTILGADNKVAVAAILEVIRLLSENKLKTKPLDIVFTLSEESGSYGVTNLDYEKLKAQKGFIFDGLVPLGSIITASPFYNRFDIKIVGKAAHASLPREAKNVLKIFCNALSNMKLGEMNSKTIVNIGMINAGHSRNAIPGEMTVKGEVRSFAEEDVEKYSNLIVSVFKKASLEARGETEAEIVRENPGYEYAENDEFITTTKKAIEDFGIKPVLVKQWACSDANIFNSRGIKVLNLGDGVVNPHTVDEQVSIQDIVNLAKLISALIS